MYGITTSRRARTGSSRRSSSNQATAPAIRNAPIASGQSVSTLRPSQNDDRTDEEHHRRERPARQAEEPLHAVRAPRVGFFHTTLITTTMHDQQHHQDQVGPDLVLVAAQELAFGFVAHARHRNALAGRRARVRAAACAARAAGLPSRAARARRGRVFHSAAAVFASGRELGEAGVDLGDVARPVRVLRRALARPAATRARLGRARPCARPCRRRPRELGLREQALDQRLLPLGVDRSPRPARARARCPSSISSSPRFASLRASSAAERDLGRGELVLEAAVRRRLDDELRAHLERLPRACRSRFARSPFERVRVRELRVGTTRRAPVRRRSSDRLRDQSLRMSSAGWYCSIASSSSPM